MLCQLKLDKIAYISSEIIQSLKSKRIRNIIAYNVLSDFLKALTMSV